MPDTRQWFPFYVADFWDEPFVRGLSHTQIGVYLRLLCDQWREGSIPSDPVAIASQAHADLTVVTSLLTKFPEQEDGTRINRRLDRERRRAFRIIAKRKEYGRLGGLAKAKQMASKSSTKSLDHTVHNSTVQKQRTTPFPLSGEKIDLGPYLDVWKTHFGAHPLNVGLLGKCLKPLLSNGGADKTIGRWQRFVLGIAKTPQYFGTEAKQFRRFAATPASFDDPEWYLSDREKAETDRLLGGL